MGFHANHSLLHEIKVSTDQGWIQDFQMEGGGGGAPTSTEGTRQISYSFNTTFLLVNFAFVKKKLQKGGIQVPSPPSLPLDPPLKVLITSLNELESVNF